MERQVITMEFIQVTPENLSKEHICCAISSDKDCQVVSKKAWLAKRFQEGLVFLKADVRGKCFIQYGPAEQAWTPVEAPNYMFIDCLWVSGKWKGQGLSTELLLRCIQDAKEKGKCGLAILSADKNRAYLAEPKFLEYKGFQIADAADPFYRLYYMTWEEGCQPPRFLENAKKSVIDEEGYVLYYSAACPFTAKYVPILQKKAEELQVPFTAHLIDSTEEARRCSTPFTTFSLFHDGEFVTNEILSEKKFEKILQERR